MTDRQRHDEQERLARLYREQGDIEPGPGVDQRIRARARADTRLSGAPRPAHWLGGVALAASLFVVVSIVTNIEPPEAELPATELNRAGGSSEAADIERLESPDAMPARQRGRGEQAEAEMGMDRAMPMLSAPPPEPLMERRVRDSAADDAERTAREQYQSLGASRQAESDRVQLPEMPDATAKAELEILDERAAGAQRALWLIDRFISIGNAERARAEVQAFRERYPGQEVPRTLLKRLEALDAQATGRQ
ncbi:MAG: hypothetical protein U5L08_09215 [Xanthomonadales bacterium]|nr:hypothetical protein [Xanthomonadales bacterium]